MSKQSWSDSYPPFSRRPGARNWPAWYQVPLGDLASFIAQMPIKHERVQSVLDLGGGDGRRIMNAMALNPTLNRQDVHVTTIDWAANAVAWGVDLWSRFRRGERVADAKALPAVRPRWSMCFREEDALALPRDLASRRHDLVVDWMFLHGLPLKQARRYFGILKAMGPQYIALKCFSVEGSTMSKLPPAVLGVKKMQWSEQRLLIELGDAYRMAAPPRACPEDTRHLHPDGPIAAKREYLFVRRKTR